MTQLADALTTALNCTFPAILRTHSWYALERLHGYATYEQWYNGEVVMHLGREVNGTEFDGEWVCVRGEAPVATRSRRLDWAILKYDCNERSAESIDPKDVLVAGETKVVGLGSAGQGPMTEGLKVDTAAAQLNVHSLHSCLRFAHFILPCWQKRGKTQSLDKTTLDSLNRYVIPKISDRELFNVNVTLADVQIVTGWYGTESDSGQSNAANQSFALLQLLLRQLPGRTWEVVQPPVQHRLSSYVTRPENASPVGAPC